MKVLWLENTSAKGAGKITAGVDSAVLRPGEPVFAPEGSLSAWRSALVPAVRMARLGMSIKASRAHQYYDDCALFHALMPAHGSTTPAGLPWLVADRALSPGVWHKIARVGTLWNIRARRTPIAGVEEVLFETSASIPAEIIDNVIEQISCETTFKTGDILLFADYALPLGSPVLDTSLTATVNGIPSIDIRIK